MGVNENTENYIGMLDFDVTVAAKFDGYETVASVDVTREEALLLKKEYLKGFNESGYELDEIAGTENLIERICAEVALGHDEEAEEDDFEEWDELNGSVQIETIPDEIMDLDIASSDEEWGTCFALATYANCEDNCSQDTYSIVTDIDSACRIISETIFEDAYLGDCIIDEDDEERKFEYEHDEDSIEYVNKYWKKIADRSITDIDDLDFELDENGMYFGVSVITGKDHIVGMVESFDTETFTTINKFKDLLEELVEYEGILDEYDCEYEYFEENEITIIDTDVIDDVKEAFNIMTEESMDF